MLLSIANTGAFAATVGATASNPVNVTFGKEYYGGWYAENDHLNYYTTFTVPKQGLVTFEFSKPSDDEGETGSMEFYLYDKNYNQIWCYDVRSEEVASPKPTYTYTVGLKKGTYTLNVLPGFYVSSGYIDFNYKYTFKATDYCEIEPNDSASKANVLTLGKFYTGFFGGEDENDYFKIPVQKGVKYRLRFKDVTDLVESSTILHMIVNGEDDWDFGGLHNMGDRYDSNGYAYEDYVSPISGYIYLKFYNYSGVPLRYDLCFSKIPVKCAAPKLKSVANAAKGVKFTWNKVAGADSYTVLRKTGNGKWTAICGGITSNTFTDKTAKSGTTYSYSVRAKNGAGVSSYNTKGLTIKRLAATSKITVANTKNGIFVKWNKVSGAAGYNVMRKTGNGNWVKIATVKTTYFTDKNAKPGFNYKYTIKAYSGKTISAYNASGIAIKRLVAPTLKAPVSTKKGVVNKWTKVVGATGYKIYRQEGNGKFMHIATVNGGSTLSHTNLNAKKGVTYTYKVTACFEKSYSAFSNTRTIKDKY